MSEKIEVAKKPIVVPSYTCNKNCSYCYVGTDTKTVMGLKQFETLLDWFKEILTTFKGITILGGEPTIVPNFDDYLTALGERGLIADIYTNGKKYPFITCDLCKRREKFSCQGGCFAYRVYGGRI